MSRTRQPFRRQMNDRAYLPQRERLAIQAAIAEMRKELKPSGKPISLQTIGRRLGGLTQPAIGMALNDAKAGPVVRDALLTYLKLTREEFLEKYAPPEAQQVVELDLDAAWREVAIAHGFDPDDPRVQDAFRTAFSNLPSLGAQMAITQLEWQKKYGVAADQRFVLPPVTLPETLGSQKKVRKH